MGSEVRGKEECVDRLSSVEEQWKLFLYKLCIRGKAMFEVVLIGLCKSAGTE